MLYAGLLEKAGSVVACSGCRACYAGNREEYDEGVEAVVREKSVATQRFGLEGGLMIVEICLLQGEVLTSSEASAQSCRKESMPSVEFRLGLYPDSGIRLFDFLLC